MKLSFIITFTLSSLLSLCAWSIPVHEKLEKAFSKDDFNLASKLITKLGNSKKNRARGFYFKGVIKIRKEEYTAGTNLLKLSLKFGKPYKNVYFEIAQAYYANNELNESLTYFKKSIKHNSKVDISYYYLGHINQILENFEESSKYYKELVKLKDVDKSLLQISLFQLSEVIFSLAIKSNDFPRSDVKKEVLPMMRLARQIDSKSDIIGDINKRIDELKKKFGLDPNFMINGRRAPAKSSYSLSQSMAYDNNVTYANDKPTSIATLQDSFIFKTDFSSSSNYIFDNTFTLKPNYSLTYTKHSNDTNADVFQNDTYGATLSLGFDYDFKLFNDPATLLSSGSYTYAARDYLQIKSPKTSGKTTTFGGGLKFKMLKKGDTTFNFSSASLESYLATLNSKTTTLSLSQNYMLGAHTMLLGFYSNSSTIAVDTNSNTVSNMYRVDLLFIEYIPTFTFQIGASANVQILEFQPARGTEATVTGSLKSTKKITNKLRYSVSYDYSDKSSDDVNFAYEKQVLTFKLMMSF